jgi:hypothetical protein
VPHCRDLSTGFGGSFTPHLSLGQLRSRDDVAGFAARATVAGDWHITEVRQSVRRPSAEGGVEECIIRLGDGLDRGMDG